MEAIPENSNKLLVPRSKIVFQKEAEKSKPEGIEKKLNRMSKNLESEQVNK